MEYVRIADYSINKGTFREIADSVKTDLLPKFQEQTGFIRYGLADTGNSKCVSLSFWTTREAAHAGETVAATWIREHLSDQVTLGSSNIGDLAFLEGVPAIA